MSFANFTKRSPIVKSLSFELKPFGKTAESIRKQGLLETDASFRKDAEAARPFIDEWIKDLIDRALSAAATNETRELFRQLGHIYDSNDKEEKAVRFDVENAIRKIVSCCVSAALPADFSLGKINSEKFISEILADHFRKDAEAMAAITAVSGKSVFLAKFFVSRITAVETNMPDRVIENFVTYHNNIRAIKDALDTPAVTKKICDIFDERMCNDADYASFLRQSDIDAYNRVISGISDESGLVSLGFNAIVSEYNQLIRKTADARALRKMEKLDKQILMPVESMFTVMSIEDDEGVREVYEELVPVENEVDALIKALRKASSDEVVVFGDALHRLSEIVFEDHSYIPRKLTEAGENAVRSRIRGDMKKSEKTKLEKEAAAVASGVTKAETFYTMADVEKVCGPNVLKTFLAAFSAANTTLRLTSAACRPVFEDKSPLRGRSEAKKVIRSYVQESWSAIRDFVNVIRSKDDPRANNEFYDVYAVVQPLVAQTTRGNNMIRNYLTRSIAKTVETNAASFGSAARSASKWYAGGRMDSRQNALVKMDGRYYLYIFPAGSKPCVIEGSDDDCEVMIYTKMQSPYQNIPKLTMTRAAKFFSENPGARSFELTEKLTEPLTISRKVFDVYNSGACKKPNTKKMSAEEAADAVASFRKAIETVLPLFIRFCNTYTVWSDRTFSFRDPSEYTDLADFYTDVEKCSVMQKWVTGDKEKILELVENGRALMFEITNRGLRHMYETGDMSRLNEYAIPFLYLFSEENRKSGTMKLNSRPGFFFRPASDDEVIVHKAGSVLVGKRDTKGGFIPDALYTEIYKYYNGMLSGVLSKEARRYIDEGLVSTRTSEYDIMKDARYHRDMYKICISYEKNAECFGTPSPINAEADLIASMSNRVILVRNQNDIVYMTVVTPSGEILESRSLDVIDGIDYHKRLGDIEKSNRETRSSSWDYADKIANIRDGYFSKAIAEIARTVVKYEAIVIMERISEHTRDKGFALGNTAYKKFETLLTARLADLHFNGIEEGQPGSITNPYQLCMPNEKCRSEAQNGIVYFVPGGGISVRDHESGYNFDFDISGINTKTAKMRWLSKFDSIRYDAESKAMNVSFGFDNFKTYGRASRNAWDLRLTGGTTVYDRETGENSYIPHPFDDVISRMSDEGVRADADLAKVMGEGRVTSTVVDMFFYRLVYCLRGIVHTHDDKRATYVSPVSGHEMDFSENSAFNLLNSFENRNMKRS